MNSISIRVALVFLGLSAIVNSSALLYPRNPAYDAPCTDPTSISCTSTTCCRESPLQSSHCSSVLNSQYIPVASAACINNACEPGTTSSTTCPTDPNLDQCPTESFCCREPLPVLSSHPLTHSDYPHL